MSTLVDRLADALIEMQNRPERLPSSDVNGVSNFYRVCAKWLFDRIGVATDQPYFTQCADCDGHGRYVLGEHELYLDAPMDSFGSCGHCDHGYVRAAAAVMTPELVEAIRALLADRERLIASIVFNRCLAVDYGVRSSLVTPEQVAMIEAATR